MNRQQALCTALVGLILAMLACTGATANLQIGNLPQYVCPSATPRVTDTPFPTSTPTWPPVFLANLNFYQLGTNQSQFYIQWLGQSVGSVYTSFWGTMQDGTPWTGSGGPVYIGYAGYAYGPFSGAHPVYVPASAAAVYVTVQAAGYVINYTVVRVPYPYDGPAGGYPCCAPPPIYPTPVATYTPYPTPTPYVRLNDYFLGDMVYVTDRLHIGFKLVSVTSQGSTRTDSYGNPQNIYVWQLYIKNVGQVEYSVFPAGQMYLSDILTEGGSVQGVWGPSVEAALEAGFTPSYDALGLLPGETHLFTLAAYGPAGTAYRLSYALDTSVRGDGPTQVPGRNIVSWLNQVNSVCTGDIQEP